MVATIDQMLTCGFNIGHWSLKEYALVGSSVVFDEIQAYDTFTLALMTETIKKIKFLDGSHDNECYDAKVFRRFSKKYWY